MRISFLEIYNEELIDLLGAESVENPRLKIYEDSIKKVGDLPEAKHIHLAKLSSHAKLSVHRLLPFM